MYRILIILGRGAAVAIAIVGYCADTFAQPAYDPLAISEASKTSAAEPIDLTIDDVKRNRQIPIRVYLPSEKVASPVVMFSHGLGGSREGSGYLGRHWSARGYTVVFLQHPGSDESVWRDVPLRQRMQTLKGAASVQNFKDRVDDVRVTIDRLETLTADATGPLAGRLDTKRLGMSGHSFGAVTTQAVSGQRQPIGGSLTEKRIKAAVVMSPNKPQNKLVSAERAFSEVGIPWLLMTGTKDDAPIGDRASALGQWCQGFLYGLGSRPLPDPESLPEQVGEIVRDLTSITQVGVDDSESDESNEQAYLELVEFVRVGAQLLFEELARYRGDPAPLAATSPSLH
jgi:predicted dienelactone hydrolase